MSRLPAHRSYEDIHYFGTIYVVEAHGDRERFFISFVGGIRFESKGEVAACWANFLDYSPHRIRRQHIVLPSRILEATSKSGKAFGANLLPQSIGR